MGTVGRWPFHRLTTLSRSSRESNLTPPARTVSVARSPPLSSSLARFLSSFSNPEVSQAMLMHILGCLQTEYLRRRLCNSFLRLNHWNGSWCPMGPISSQAMSPDWPMRSIGAAAAELTRQNQRNTHWCLEQYCCGPNGYWLSEATRRRPTLLSRFSF